LIGHFPGFRAWRWAGGCSRFHLGFCPARARAFVSAGNVLLLKNVINLNPDAGEVSQQKLLSLVAERLIDSNTSAQVRSPLLPLPLRLSLFVVFISDENGAWGIAGQGRGVRPQLGAQHLGRDRPSAAPHHRH
jgi:hypothetical protein